VNQPGLERTGNGAARINGKDFLQFLKVRAGQEYGYDEGRENLLLAFSNNSLYLDTVAIRKRGISVPAFEQFLIQVARKADHIAGAYLLGKPLSALSNNHEASIGELLQNSFRSGRSGDLTIICSEYSFFSGDTAGTTHGSPYSYDRHVPLILAGPMIRQGTFDVPCSPLDISPTLAAVLKITASPPPEGKELKSAISSIK
jgi:hypothetical protein